MDTIGYSEARFREIKEAFNRVIANREFAKKISVIPISASSGNNLIKRTNAFGWYKGPTLYMAVLKDFITTRKIAVTPGQNKTSMARPVCIFIDAPKSNLILESANGTASIKSISGYQRIHILQPVSVILVKPLFLGNKFVIKQKGRIIGVCRITE